MVANLKTPKISVGITSLVVILTVLCLTIFSVLALSTALNEKNLSEKSAKAIGAYYEAENKCALVANEAGKHWEEVGAKTDWQRFAMEYDADCQIEENRVYLSYSRPIDEKQSLLVEIQIDDAFTVTKWQVEAIGDWVPDDSLQLWDGEM